MIAALFVDPTGPYVGLSNVDNGGKSGGTFPSQTLILRPYPRTVEACPTVLKPFDSQGKVEP